MTIESHDKGSHKKKGDARENGKEKKMSQEELDQEIVEMKASINALMMLLEECEKDQWYGWTLRRKKVRWKLLQTKLRQNMYANLRRELRVAELEMKVYYCEPEKGAFFDEDEDKDVEEKLLIVS
jgi:hypothetical protein